MSIRIPAVSISQLVPNQFPIYIRENFPAFLAFITAYYEYQEQQGNLINGVFTVQSDRDIDLTVDNFVQYFLDEFMPNIPSSILTNPRTLLKHIKDFYRAKGTEKAYKLLFQILYNEDVSFYYPKNDLMKTSDNTWIVNTVMRTTTFNNTFNFVGHLITGVQSGASAAVENVLQFQIGSNLISELSLSDITGTFELGEKIQCTVNGANLQENTYNLVSGINITNPGLLYNFGDLVNVTDGSGTDAVAVVRETTGTQTGRVVSAANTTIVNPGPNQYTLPPNIVLTNLASNQDNYYVGMPVTITDGPNAGETKTIVAYTGATQTAIIDSDWINVPTIQNHYSISLGQILKVEVTDFGIGYDSSTTVDFSQAGNGEATGTVTISTVASYPGQWENTNSFVSNIKKLQDSFYYQDFSYVLKTQESINTYSAIVKTLLHPAGTILFGDVNISSLLSFGPDFRTLELNKLFFQPYPGYTQEYSAPNQNYWVQGGYTNTPWIIEQDVIINNVETLPQTRRNHVADTWIGLKVVGNSIPTNNEIVEYNCIEQGSDTQTLYDILYSPGPFNGIFGSTSGSDSNDPVYGGGGTNVVFSEELQFIDCASVPVNPVAQTVLIVANTSTLAQKQSIIGCIDADMPNITGFSIDINTDGSLTFNVNLFNGSNNTLSVSSPTDVIFPNNWFCATLSYTNNVLNGYLNIQAPYSNSYSTNIAGTSIQNNSSGWFIGNQGFVPPFNGQSFWKSSFWGHTLWNAQKYYKSTNISVDASFNHSFFNGTFFNGGTETINNVIPIIGVGNSFLGTIAYAIIWNTALNSSDILQSYIHLKNILTSRGITLP